MKLVSGGQTGADRAALDVARELGLPSGGWVPRGRRAEDGRIPDDYTGLRETDSPDYSVRTARNVDDSDATLVVCYGAPTGGTALTVRLARQRKRPLLVLDLERHDPAAAAAELRQWLAHERPGCLNVAGPRASHEPRIGAAVAALLRAALTPEPVSES